MKYLGRTSLAVLALALVGLGVHFVWSQVATPPEIPTRLQHLTNGTVRVEFKGQPGAQYQIWWTDYWPGDLSATGAWRVAADRLQPTNTDWTAWVDEGAPDRPIPAEVEQRYYQVLRQSALTNTPVSETTATTAVAPTTPSSTTVTTGTALPPTDPRLVDLQEAYDSGRLMGALATGDNATALDVLRTHGVAESTLAMMGPRLAGKPARVRLTEPFLKGVLMWGQRTPAEFDGEMALARSYGCDRAFWVDNVPFQSLPASDGAIGALWGSAYEPNTIRLFQWFDQNAARLHSIAINLGTLHNEFPEVPAADRQLMIRGLYRLVKARQPDMFVWVTVWHGYDGTDTQFLRSLDFQPDGLLIVNLQSFRSPLEQTRDRYQAIVGTDTPLVLLDFQGYWPATETDVTNPQLGKLLAAHWPAFEKRLQALGYRGLIMNWRTLHHLEAAAK